MRLYHLTSKVDFRLDPKYRPTNNTTMGGTLAPGVFLTDDPQKWANGFGYWQPWVVEFEVPGDLGSREGVIRGHLGEFYVPAEHYGDLRLVRVIPLDAYAREAYGEYGWTETFFGTTFDTEEPIEGNPNAMFGPRARPPAGWRYPGDARQADSGWRQRYTKRVRDYARQSGLGNGVYGSRIMRTASLRDPSSVPNPGPMPNADYYAGGGCVDLALAFLAAYPHMKMAVEWYDDRGRRAIAHAVAYDPRTRKAFHFDGTEDVDDAVRAATDAYSLGVVMDQDPGEAARQMGVRWSPSAPWDDDRIFQAWSDAEEHWGLDAHTGSRRIAMPGFRTCDGCGHKMPFGRRRNRVDGRLLCDGCTPGKPGAPGRPVGYHGSKETPMNQPLMAEAAAPDLEHCGSCGSEIGDAGLVRQGALLVCAGGCKTAATATCEFCRKKIISIDDRWVLAERSPDGLWRTECEVDPDGEHAPDGIPTYSSRKVAHDSGDGERIFHCPFCFAGNVRYLTRDGIKSFAETAGTSQWVLTADPDQRTAGRWVQAEVKEFGEQPLMKVTLRRNKRTRVIEATPEHRWLVKSDKRVAGAQARSTDRDVLTRDLRPGQRLSYLRAPGLSEEVSLDASGIRHGIVFGDGSAQGKTASVSLWGEKDKQLLQFFPDRRYKDVNTANRVFGTGVPGVHVTGDLWAWMKALPDADDPNYLYGFLAGYFAADGTVSKQGQIVINSANLDHLEAVRDIALRLGITTYGITSKMRVGFPGREPSALYGLEFVGSTLREDFFLIEEHRDRFRFRDYGFERIGWTVVSVEATTKVETVYCAVVPGTHTFALEGNIWVGNCGAGQVTARSDGTAECGFCETVFTVQVQPKHPSMPQTIDGKPVDDPSMPGNGQHEDPSPATQVPAEPGPEGFAPAGAGGPEGFLPAGTARRYRTASGAVLGEDAYLRHLAIAFADDKDAAIDQVRANRSAS